MITKKPFAVLSALICMDLAISASEDQNEESAHIVATYSTPSGEHINEWSDGHFGCEPGGLTTSPDEPGQLYYYDEPLTKDESPTENADNEKE